MQFANWNIGRIVNVYPGQDGKARNVRVKTSTGVHDRPVTKIVKNVLIKLECVSLNIHIIVINNGNCTEWSAIWAEIIRVISKSNERAARVRFEITSMIGCFVFSVASSLAGKKMRFKANNGAIHE